MRSLIRRGPAWGLAAALTLCAAGCAGSGRVETVPLDYRSIDPPPAKVAYLDLDHCYWWTDESGQVWIALEAVRRPLFSPLGELRFQMSLVFDELPAGQARNYLVSKRELRAVARLAVMEGRFVSAAGIVALYRAPGNRLHGSFRLLAQRQVTQMLGGWGPPSSHLLQGTFEAVHDPQRGRPIAAATESRGWEREPSATAPEDAAGAPGSR